MKFRLLILIIFFILINPGILFSQTGPDKGIIRGKITDAESGESLCLVNVILLGTSVGASTEKTGEYIIRSIPPGTYTIQASMMGYKTEKIQNIQVTGGRELILDFQLKPSVLESPPIIVTASKKTQEYGDIPVSVSVLNKDFIKKVEHFDISNALKYVSGVNFADDQVNIRNHAGYRRGTGSTVILMIDGIPLMPGDTGDIKWDIVPIENIKRVEVLKGPGSALYGSAAMGGVINIITENPDKTSTAIDLTGGFYDDPYYKEWKWSDNTRYFQALNVSHSTNVDKFKILLSAGTKKSDGYRENDYQTTRNFFGKMRYDFSSNEYLNMYTSYANQHRGLWIQWEDMDNALRIKSRDFGNTVDSDKFQLSFNYYKLLSEKFGFNAKGYNFYTKFESNTQDGYDYSECNRTGLELQGDVKLADNHFLLWGIDAVGDRVTSNMFGKHGGFGTAAYLQDEFEFTDKIKLTSGIRFDYKKIDILEPEYQFSPKAGLTFSPNPGCSFWVSVGKGFRYPLISEAFMNAVVSGFVIEPNEDIKSESSMSYEIGTNLNITGRYRFEGAVFLNKYEDMIEAYTDTSKANLIFQNLTKAEINGFELSLVGSPLKNLNFSFNYTHTSSTDLTNGINEPLAYRPDDMLNFMCEYDFGLLTPGFNYRYVSKTEKYKVFQHDRRVPLYLLDIWTTLNLSKDLSFNFKINNLYNYNYAEIERNLYPIRNYILAVRKSF